MMNSFRQPKKSAPLLATFASVVFLSVVVFGFDTLTGGLVRSYARTVGSVAWGSVAGVSQAVDSTGYFATRASLVKENNELAERLALYEEQSARYRALEIQNEALREIASLAESERGGKAARVLSSFRASPYGTFIIAAGERDGIARGDIVLTPGGFALGSVSDLDAHTATVDALFSPGKMTEVLVNDIAFDAEGRGGGNARASIPRGAEVAVGDAAIVPQFGGRIAGVIGAIESASSSATQTLYLRLPHNTETLRFVYVVPFE
jgi:cell shape-determining protein MreC